ncbi:AIPR family protein [Salinispora arenicola]|uniref:AIPR family protein n=1 Tax=Salinispora arenicola TaxID=168697 RepID=UPI0003641359|nr:AIPR family protein [Salinispora arenicola]
MADQHATGFAERIWEEILDRIAAEPHLMQRDAFLQIVAEHLIEDGVLEDMQACYFRAPAGRGTMEVAGYAITGEGSTLDLASVDLGFRGATVLQHRVHRQMHRAVTFAERCHEGLCRDLEKASPAHDMAQHIQDSWSRLEKIRVLLFTDGRSTVRQLGTSSVAGVPVTYELWDITRIERLMTSGVRQDDIDIDLSSHQPPVTCLPAPDNADGYRCLMALVPGPLLANLYEQHGGRLLQRNVRAFLQNRNKVNRGINTTVNTEPTRFLAYNNGISATAQHADVDVCADGIHRITRLVDLQIVNGGQTTASLHHAWKRDGADLSQILVAAKITVVNGSQLEELVPKISRYANSQNVIREADFEANSQFHVELERLSRSIWAPAAEGNTEQKRWYYERVRGQYEVDANRAGATSTRRAAFKKQHPRFSKTDAAKYVMSYAGQPHIVSLGAEKCFQRWTEDVVRPSEQLPDVAYFKGLVAKSILFDGTRKVLWGRSLGGYLMQTTAYVLALMVERVGDKLRLEDIWRTQRLPDWAEEAVGTLADRVRPVLVSPPGSANVTEWCKKEACWKLVQNVEWTP